MADIIVKWDTVDVNLAEGTVTNGYTVSIDGGAPVPAVSPYTLVGGAGAAGTVHTAVVDLVDVGGVVLATASGNGTVPTPVVGKAPANVSISVA